MSDIMSFEGMALEHLAEAANDAADQVEKSARNMVQHADRSGRALLAAKAQLEHGDWLPWLGANFDQSISLANKYMAIASNSERIPNLKEAPSITQAMRMITEAREEQSPKQAGVVVSKPAADPAESKDVIEVDSKPVEPKPPKPSSNPRSDAASRNNKPAAPEFDLGSSLDEHRSAILEMAGDYAAAKQTKHFIVMLRKVATDLETTTPGGAS
jgi:hypothetical protein